MIRLIEALNYRCLRYVRQPLQDFHVLVGPNASGKSTFLDVVSFLGDLVSEGLNPAVEKRTSNFSDLLFGGEGDHFELAVEMKIAEDQRKNFPAERPFGLIRYEISIGLVDNAVEILEEKVMLREEYSEEPPQRLLFPCPEVAPQSIITEKQKNGRLVVSKKRGGNDNYYSEIHERSGKGWAPSIRLGPGKSALANLPADEHNFPVSTWFLDILREGVQQLMLDSKALRLSSPPGQGSGFKANGDNLPWVLSKVRNERPDLYKKWIAHIRTALPDLREIDTVEFLDIRHRYLKLIYDNGLEIPSWMTSDGTLRLLALTLLAYLPDFEGVYLIEEPENGIHPMAMESVFQALRSVYGAQMLLATHSPVVLGCAELKDILCFKKTDEGATDIVTGIAHPALKQWQGSLNLSDLYASGVLG
jgi:predicted ATPase